MTVTTDTTGAAPERVGVPVEGRRAAGILARFPRYLEADDPGKRLGAVVTALATGVDVLTRQVQDVRTAHRVSEAPTTQDLLALASLHGLTDARLALLDLRTGALGDLVGTEPLDTAALAAHLAVPVAALDAAVTAEPEAVAAALARALHHRGLMARRREVVRGVLIAHTRGNGTPSGLLTAAAAYVGLRVGAVRHVADDWWHLATCTESHTVTVPPGPPAPDGTPSPPPPDLSPHPDVLALEENPFRHADIEPSPKRHGQRTRVLRGGLDDVSVSVRVLGTGDRTVRPMVVHLGTGTGVAFEGDVPDGAELSFGASGRVSLGGSDVTGSAWSFHGAVFADADQALASDDFSFTEPDGGLPVPGGEPVGGQAGRFAVTAPVASAFDLPSGLPHGAAAVGPLVLPRGESRWTVLTRQARTGGVTGPPAPRPFAGRFDEAVFAADVGETLEPSLQLGFAWEEREPFAVRVLLPQRLSAVDDESGSLLREPLRRLLDRHRAAGVSLRVEYADPRWRLGEGVVRAEEDDALGVVLAGTRLWPDDPPDDP
ncbi:hypothetical protein [Jannaschia sp. R86511]|uniref:hypothetical protein n=1 Tax=Jannaschia sp. R86511 TaxID=3093853 RepID=UPI0036D22DBB